MVRALAKNRVGYSDPDLNEAEAVDAYACAFTGFIRLEWHLMNRDMVRSQGGFCDPSAKVDARAIPKTEGEQIVGFGSF
jgi:hypothetical protein